MKVAQIFVEEWQYSLSLILDETREEYMRICDIDDAEYDRLMQLTERVNALVDEIPDDLIVEAYWYADNVHDHDWAEIDKPWLSSYRDVAIAVGAYREFTEEDAQTLTWSSRTGRTSKKKPDFKHRGKAWIFEMHPEPVGGVCQ